MEIGLPKEEKFTWMDTGFSYPKQIFVVLARGVYRILRRMFKQPEIDTFLVEKAIVS